MGSAIDFYFDFSSPYGFLASTQIDALASRFDREIVWRPFLLGAVYKKVGQSPLDHPLKRDFVNYVDVCRCARLLGLDIKTPRGWPEHSIPPARVFYWLTDQDAKQAAEYARAAYRAYWLEGNSTADAEIAASVAENIGVDRATAAAAIQDQSIKDRFVAENEAAIAHGVFGSPFIFIDGERFWGNDRLNHIAIYLERGTI